MAEIEQVRSTLEDFQDWQQNRAVTPEDNTIEAYVAHLENRQQVQAYRDIYDEASDNFNTDAELGAYVRERLGIPATGGSTE